MTARRKTENAPNLLGSGRGVYESNYEEGIEMNPITTNNTSQSSSIEELSSRQHQLLKFFGSMTDSAQEFIVSMAEHNARAFPRQRPKLRVIAGGAA